jgi:hypothetical protein
VPVPTITLTPTLGVRGRSSMYLVSVHLL